MNLTAIIAARDELPYNLQRTVDGIRGAGVPVDVRHDSPPMGCGWRRHEGIMACPTEGVFLCDGHMEFGEGYFAGIAAELDRTPDALLVTRMQSMSHDWTPKDGMYYGAEIALRDEWPGGQFVPIAAKWRREETGDGDVGAVMGACYAFTRSSYERWGRPLAILRAWGCDEEALSIAAWMTGGRVRLVPGLARHMYQAPRGRAPELSDEEAARVWANRLALLNAIPMPESDRAGLVEWMRRTPWLKTLSDRVNRSLSVRAADVERMRAALESGPMTWRQYVRKWCIKPEGAADMARGNGKGKGKAKSKATTTTAGRPEGRANYGPRENRRECHACGSVESTVESMRRTGGMIVRYRVCKACGRRRVTQELVG